MLSIVRSIMATSHDSKQRKTLALNSTNDSLIIFEQPRTQALYVHIIQLYIERSVNKLASARGCLGRF